MNPVLINRWRGNSIENRHRGAVAIVESSGRLMGALGDIQRAVFPRSAIKYLQAIPFVESGAVEAYGLDDRHIALACASHNGEPIHVGLAQDWLSRLSLTHDDLECGAELPLHEATQFDLLADGRGPQRIHHNCSGKHLGMLSTCCHLGEQTRNYRLYNHDAQKRWFEVIESSTNTRVMQLPWGYDGCAIPTLALPLQRIALGMARFGDKDFFNGARREAVQRIRKAVTENPYLVAGKERLCTDLMDRLAPGVLIKVGADGVYAAVLPKLKIGVALKIDDGHQVAAGVALGAVLQSLGVINRDDMQALGEYLTPSIANSRGETIGRTEPSSDWEQLAVAG